VLLVETEEQEITSIPCWDLGCDPVVRLPQEMRALL
jgi:hypothetical protein